MTTYWLFEASIGRWRKSKPVYYVATVQFPEAEAFFERVGYKRITRKRALALLSSPAGEIGYAYVVAVVNKAEHIVDRFEQAKRIRSSKPA